MPSNATSLRAVARAVPSLAAQGERLAFTSRCIPLAGSAAFGHHCSTARIPKTSRSFSTTPSFFKKKGRAEREAEEEAASKSSPVDIEDPFDFSALNGSLERNIEKLKADLNKLRTGGKFNPETLEDLRVSLNKESKKSERLGDLAQVVPKGRTLQVMVGEKDHVKPIMSTIQSSTLNMTPVQDAQNSLLLSIPIPAPTKESRDAALALAKKAGDTAAMGVKNARAASQKRLGGMKKKKSVRPDDMTKAEKEMEKIVKNAGDDIKKIVDAARKAMEQQ